MSVAYYQKAYASIGLAPLEETSINVRYRTSIFFALSLVSERDRICIWDERQGSGTKKRILGAKLHVGYFGWSLYSAAVCDRVPFGVCFIMIESSIALHIYSIYLQNLFKLVQPYLLISFGCSG